MKTGKLPADVLTRLLLDVHTDSRVIVGPTYGEDAAAVRFGGSVLVAATDPITFATDRIGKYAVDVNANDVAVAGAIPRHFLAVILLPQGSSESEAEVIFHDIEKACRAIDVTLIGGHTEITAAVNQAVVSGCMLGECAKNSLVSTRGARVGDAIVLARPIAIEGTAILANEPVLDVDPTTIENAARLLDEPGISVLPYARAAVEIGGVTAMHDPTEGGLAMALREVASASGKGMRIRREAIPILDECRVICEALKIDPLGLIASGSLLITADPKSADSILAGLCGQGIEAALIGEMGEAQDGVLFDDGSELPVFERDEIAKYFDRSA
ncbi:MAG: hypothetical protein GX141_07835 [Armatimonadetes bacterium]|nr:hypothetical protein [Armatimonadota bacterium]